jgi:hypothetical protein
LYNRGSDELWLGLDLASRDLKLKGLEASGEATRRIDHLVRELIAEQAKLEKAIREGANDAERQGREEAAFQKARRYCLLEAAGVAVQMWTQNVGLGSESYRTGEWLVIALERIIRQFRPDREMDEMPYVEETAAAMLEAYRANRLYSILPIQLAGRGPCADEQ